MTERVVVTGLGVVSCVGNDPTAFWDALIHGRSGIGPITAFDATPFKTRIAGEVKNFAFDPKTGKRMERFTQFAVRAAEQALGQAGLLELLAQGQLNPQRVGAVVGTGIGGFPFLEAEHAKFLAKGPGKFHPLTVPIIITNMASANISIQFGLKGPNYTISNACSTGNHALISAMDCIRLGRADVMVAGGVESTISPFALDGYIQLRALSTHNDDPTTASRPFSRDRDGFVLAEGGGVLVLESLSHAQKRGAHILAEMAGGGMSADAYHITAPEESGSGAAQAMLEALKDAKLPPEAIGYINAHGTSTPLNDAIETTAIKAVFGAHAYRAPVSSIKSMVGHALGGASGIEAVACVLTLQNNLIPPTINLNDPDPALDLDYVPNTAREAKPQAVMSNAFAFGGHNGVVIFSRWA